MLVAFQLRINYLIIIVSLTTSLWGLLEIWDVIERFREAVGEKGILRRRAEQARAWMWNEVGETLLAELKKHPGVRKLVGGLEREVEAGRATPAAAARHMLEAFHGR